MARGWRDRGGQASRVIPTLAERSRQRQRLAFSRGERSGFCQPQDLGPPAGLVAYLNRSEDRPHPPSPQASEERTGSTGPEQRSSLAMTLTPEGRRPWLAVLVWLGLLLFDGALALHDLLTLRRPKAPGGACSSQTIAPRLSSRSQGSEGALLTGSTRTGGPLSCC